MSEEREHPGDKLDKLLAGIKLIADDQRKIRDDHKRLSDRMDKLDVARRLDSRRDEGEAREMAALSRQLDEGRKALKEVQRRTEDREPGDAAAMADAQARADAVAMAFGDPSKRASAPMLGESELPYRARLLRQFQPHSKVWKDEDLVRLARTSPSAFANAERQIYADAVAESNNPTDLGPWELREVHKPRVGAPGMSYTEFRGPSTLAWMNDFMMPRMRYRRMNTPADHLPKAIVQ